MNTDSFFDFWDKSDPYLKLLKIRQDNTYLQACKTQYINNDLNPDWKPIIVEPGRLHDQNCTKFKVQCWDYEESGKDQFIGEAFLDVKELKDNPNFPIQIPLVNPKSKKPGSLVLERFRSIPKPTFVDYLKGGMQLNMIVAIDFTASIKSRSLKLSHQFLIEFFNFGKYFLQLINYGLLYSQECKIFILIFNNQNIIYDA